MNLKKEKEHLLILKDREIEREFGIDIKTIGKRLIYNGIPYVIDFGNPTINENPLMDFLSQSSDYSPFRDKIIQYRKSLLNQDGSVAISKDIYHKSSIIVEQFPIIKLSVKYSNEIFVFYIVGTEGRVFADKIPTTWDKFCAWLH